jgi:hypothetical protein
MAKLAIQQIEAASTTMRDGGDVPNAAYFDAQLPKARALAQKLANAEGSKPRRCGKQHAIDAQRAPVHSSSCGALLRLCEAICDLCRF